jgi:hypothetical protein
MTNDKRNPDVLDQYKLAVEMADRVSGRRGAANGFYLTAASALLATSEGLSLAVAAIAGMALSLAWWAQLTSYRNLNAAKWKVIGNLEKELSAQPSLTSGRSSKQNPWNGPCSVLSVLAAGFSHSRDTWSSASSNRLRLLSTLASSSRRSYTQLDLHRTIGTSDPVIDPGGSSSGR